MQRKPLRTATKLMLFTVSKDECSMPKGTSQAEAMSNSEKIKPVALAVIKLCLTEGISEAVSQSEENNFSVATF